MLEQVTYTLTLQCEVFSTFLQFFMLEQVTYILTLQCEVFSAF